MKKLFLCSYFTGVKDIFKDFMNYARTLATLALVRVFVVR